jgi:hypothetical protein
MIVPAPLVFVYRFMNLMSKSRNAGQQGGGALYEYDENGVRAAAGGRPVSAEEQALIDDYNARRSALDAAQRRAIDDFMRQSLPMTTDATQGAAYSRAIDPAANTAWLSAAISPRRDPLAIDLDGDGIESIGTDGHVVRFDHDGDGMRTGTGWLAPDDAWLVLDRNGNRRIDSGAELFGIDTPLDPLVFGGGSSTASDGFQALRALDENLDGVFDAADAAYWQVQVWQDANQNGLTDYGELGGLYNRRIQQIDLQPAVGSVELALRRWFSPVAARRLPARSTSPQQT